MRVALVTIARFAVSKSMGDSVNEIRRLAVSFLARREYGARELENKLVDKGFSRDEVAQEMNYLREMGWQSDQRFAESLLHSRVSSGYGPYRIENELLVKGVDSSLVHALLRECGVDWLEQGRRSRIHRFGNQISSDRLVRQKQQRYLLYKGFSLEQIKEALNE